MYLILVFMSPIRNNTCMKLGQMNEEKIADKLEFFFRDQKTEDGRRFTIK